MLKKAIFVLLLASTGRLLYAQTDSTETTLQNTKPPRPLHWELATDLLSLTNKAVLPPHLFVRRHFKNNSALRLRVGWDMKGFSSKVKFIPEGTDDVNPKLNDEFISAGYFLSPFLSIGYERATDGKRIRAYYGLDLNLKANSSKSKRILIPISPSQDSIYAYNKIKVSGMGISLSGFLGLKYHLSETLSISSEFSAILTYNKTLASNRVEYYRIQDNKKLEDTNNNLSLLVTGGKGYLLAPPVNEYIFKIHPIYSISFSYHF